MRGDLSDSCPLLFYYIWKQLKRKVHSFDLKLKAFNKAFKFGGFKKKCIWN